MKTTGVGTFVAAGGIALGVVFLGLHHADLTRALTTAAALAGLVGYRGLIRLPDLASSWAGAAVAALVVFAWYGVGDALLRRRPQRVDVLGVARTIAFGAGVWSLAWFVLGVAGVYTPRTAIGVLAVGVSLAAFALARRGPTGLWSALRLRRLDVPPAAASLIALGVTAAFTAALAPPTAKDSLIYHMALPKSFAAAVRRRPRSCVPRRNRPGRVGMAKRAAPHRAIDRGRGERGDASLLGGLVTAASLPVAGAGSVGPGERGRGGGHVADRRARLEARSHGAGGRQPAR